MSAPGSPDNPLQRTARAVAPTDEVEVSIPDLRFGQSPRLVPVDLEHARVLAEVDRVLPPILIRAETMVVIDGRHRVLAAQLRGETYIRAQFFHGSENEALILGVRANTTHGKPLSLPERVQAASQIIASSPHLSDRAIAGVCGLAPHTVAGRRKAVQTNKMTERVGADGRVRRLSSQIAREHAAELMSAFPDQSNRKIARDVGLSEATVRSVRRRLVPSVGTSVNTAGIPATPASVGPAPDGKSRDRAPVVERSDCSQCASWLVAHSSDETCANLLKDSPAGKQPPVIVEALRISEDRRTRAMELENQDKGDK